MIGASKILRDIAERKRIEESRYRLAAIVDSADDAIISKDLNGIIRTWNEGARRMFGYTSDEIVGHSILRLIPKHMRGEEDEILRKLEENGKGRILNEWGVWIEVIALNFSDPWTEVDGERSSPKTQHPIFSDRAVRDAMNLLVDRGSIAKFIYVRTGAATANWLNAPEKVTSKTTSWEISIEKANQILDSAGWAKGPDGVRTKDGKKLKFLFQTSINAPRQKTQAIVKQACQKAGIELELKSVPASVFFSSDVANPDTYTHFYADMQLWTPQTGGPPDPEQMMDRFTTWELTSKANRWQGRNVYRWRSEDYDRLYRSVQSEFDPVKRASLFIEMNNLLIKERVIIPVVWRADVLGLNNKIRANLSPWDSPFWQLHDWYREA